MKINEELRSLTLEELNTKLLDLRKAQFKLRMERANGILEKSHRIAAIRKDIARVKTFLGNKVQKS